MQMQALGNDTAIGAQGKLLELIILQQGPPFVEPLGPGDWIMGKVVEGGHQVRLPLAAGAQQYHRPGLLRAGGFDGLQQVKGRVRDFQEFPGGDIEGSGSGLVFEIDRGPLELLAPKLIAQLEAQHDVHRPRIQNL